MWWILCISYSFKHFKCLLKELLRKVNVQLTHLAGCDEEVFTAVLNPRPSVSHQPSSEKRSVICAGVQFAHMDQLDSFESWNKLKARQTTNKASLKSSWDHVVGDELQLQEVSIGWTEEQISDCFLFFQRKRKVSTKNGRKGSKYIPTCCS